MLSAVLAIVNRPSVCPSVCHTLQGTVSKRLHLRSCDSSFLVVHFSAKFQREHREPGRQM